MLTRVIRVQLPAVQYDDISAVPPSNHIAEEAAAQFAEINKVAEISSILLPIAVLSCSFKARDALVYVRLWRVPTQRVVSFFCVVLHWLTLAESNRVADLYDVPKILPG